MLQAMVSACFISLLDAPHSLSTTSKTFIHPMVAGLKVWRFLLIQNTAVNPKKKVIQTWTGISLSVAGLLALS